MFQTPTYASKPHFPCPLLHASFLYPSWGATEIEYGVADLGCENDIKEAFDLVSKMVDEECCMGFGHYDRGNTSSYLLENKDRRIVIELDRYYQMAKEIIATNKDKVDAIVEALIREKTLMGKDIKRIMAA